MTAKKTTKTKKQTVKRKKLGPALSKPSPLTVEDKIDNQDAGKLANHPEESTDDQPEVSPAGPKQTDVKPEKTFQEPRYDDVFFEGLETLDRIARGETAELVTPESTHDRDRPSKAISGKKKPSKAPKKVKKPNIDKDLSQTLQEIRSSIAALTLQIEAMKGGTSQQLGAGTEIPMDVTIPQIPHTVALRRGQPAKFTDPEKLLSAVNDYFRQNELNVKEVERVIKGVPMMVKQRTPLSMAGLARHLGMKRTTLNSYTNTAAYAIWQKEDPEKAEIFSNIITRARGIIEEDNLNQGLMGNHNPNLSILNLSSNYGYTSKSEHKVDEKLKITVKQVSYKGASGIDFQAVKQIQQEEASHMVLDVDAEEIAELEED
jgi:hypothetical protein